ncbi:MAG: two-component regulator propeller domain-containing protein, partial [Bacteroidota bacterium]
GTAWIGTDFGLARFSSGVWTIFNNSNSPLASNDIRSLCIGTNNTKFIGTFSAGLYTFNDTVWTNLNTSNSSLPDDYIRSLTKGPSVSVWVGTTAGLVRMDSSGSWTVYTMWNSVLGSNNIACLHHDTVNSEVWAGTVNGGVLRVANDTVLSSFTIQNSGISDNTILGIDQDASGNMLFVSPANGLIVKLNPFGWFTYNLVSSNIPTSGLTCILADSLQDAWIGSFNKGLIRKSGTGFSYSDSTNSPLEDIIVQCLARDSAGRIWIGTQTAGLYILDTQATTGIETLHVPDATIRAYPNPAGRFIRLAGVADADNLEIVSPEGRVVFYGNTNQGVLDLAGLPPGLLLIRSIDENWKPVRVLHQPGHF